MYPMVVSSALCPQMIWAMCGGRPLMIASVTKILLKSWGEKISGSPVASLSPLAASASMSSLRLALGVKGAVFVADAALKQQRHRRVPDPLPDVVGRHQGYRAVGCAQAGDDGAEHVGEFGANEQQPFSIGLGRGDL